MYDLGLATATLSVILSFGTLIIEIGAGNNDWTVNYNINFEMTKEKI